MRFKTDIRGGARAVREFGEDTEATAAKLELLKQISDRIEHQTLALILAFRQEARAIDEVGDEAVGTAAELSLLSNTQRLHLPVLRKSLTSWSFWKDRLSLTRAELSSVILTIGGYLLPALVAMGTSMAAAAVGGTAVLTATLGALVVGLSGAGILAATVAGNFQKITTAQEAYNLAIQQYGAGSEEAARAAGKLYAVIRTEGGKPVFDAVRALGALRTAWTKLTAPGRASLFATAGAGIGAAQRLLPTFGRETNKNAMSIQRNLSNAFSVLSGGETRQTIIELSKTFRTMAGPGSRAGVNLIIVLMRILRAAAPWVVKWAESWEKTTSAWKRGTSDSTKLSKNITFMVGHLKSWWALTKAVAGVLFTVFRGANREGQSMVNTLTIYINKFNDWLRLQVHTGAMQHMVRKYAESVGMVFTALGLLLTHPTEFIDKYIPMWADAFARAAGTVVLAFINAWWHSSLWGKLFIGWMLTKWLIGVNLFGVLARHAGARFVTAFGIYLGPRMAAMFAAEGLIGAPIVGAGDRLGRSFGRKFVGGMVVGIAALAFVFKDELERIGSEAGKGIFRKLLPDVDLDFLWNPHDWQNILPKGKAAGGLIPTGTSAFVGERGLEMATATPAGAMIRPMTGSSGLIEPPQRGSLAISDILPPLHVHVDVDRREIGRANVNWNDERKSLRGER